ncbi:hypothetical protein [Pseudoalteromonas spongiae]|uniref:hypothetical protein n=1 Tax=Pseudoalteromonas spongiae TaxID=298657 RepID=UPI00026C9E23|nr:hypothetical protein [Pseudoalteromonas spongiae]
MKMLKTTTPLSAILLASMLFVVSGCAVKLIASYDETTDKNVTALQRKFETFLTDLEAKDGLPECSYDKNSKFYSESKVDLSAIKVRAEAIPKNDITVQQVSLLDSSLDSLESLHKLKDKKSKSSGELKCISANEITPLRNAFNSSFTAILKLELEKKRGED